MGSWPRDCEDVADGGYAWANFTGWHACIDPDIWPWYNRGCGAACAVCMNDDGNGVTMGTRVTSGRFIRPDPGVEGRDYLGRYVWPTATPWHFHARYPYWSGYGQSAMCYRPGNFPMNDTPTREKWDKSICNCASGSVSAPGDCGLGSQHLCAEAGSIQVTCSWHTHQDWPGSHQTIICPGENLGRGPLQVRMPEGILGVAGVLSHSRQTFDNPGALSRGCSPNWNTRCTGEKAQSPGCEYAGQDGNLHPTAGHFNFWRQLVLFQIAARFQAEDQSDHVQAVVAAKNSLLAWLETHKSNMPLVGGVSSNMDRVDLPIGQSNNHWSRAWNGHPSTENLPLAQIAANHAGAMGTRWENCYLAKSGHQIIASYVPYDIWIDVVANWANLQQDQRPCQDPTTDAGRAADGAVYPQIILKVRMRMGIHLEWPDPDNQHWLRNDAQPVIWLPGPSVRHEMPLEIENFDLLHRQDGRIVWGGGIGYFEGQEADRVIYVDNDGRQFDRRPPLDWTWEGEMGPDRDHNDLFGTQWFVDGGREKCCGIAWKLRYPGIKVRPAYNDPNWPHGTVPIPSQPPDYVDIRRTRQQQGYVRLGARWGLGTTPAGC